MPIAVPRRAMLALLAALTLTAMIASGAEAAAPGQLQIDGYNAYGELGIGSKEEPKGPTLVPGLSKTVTEVAGGYYATYALLSNGQMEDWGYNKYSELGDGTTNEHSSPEIITLPSSATAVAAGEYFGMALLSNGTVATWGYGGYGELGNGKTEEAHSPLVIPGLEHVTAIAAGCKYAMALRSDGRVLTWGEGEYGEQGSGETEKQETPTLISGLENVVKITAGCYSGYAILANGQVKAWGYNGYGELGDGTKTQRDAPVPIPGLSNVASLAAGEDFAIALHTNGTLSGWGYNYYDELGDGTKEERLSPETLTAWPAGVSGISTAGYDSYAVLPTGESFGAGYNGYDELGDGNTEEHITPQALSSFLPGVVAFGHGNYNYDLLAIQGAFASLSSTALGFANQSAGTSSPAQSVVISNKGPAPLTVSGDVLTGSGAGSFTKSSDGCQGVTLAVGETCTIALAFTPSAPGTVTATLAVSSTAANALSTVSLTGTAPTPPPPPAPTAPVLGSLSLSHSVFRAATSGASAIAASAIGTLISYSDSKAATTTFTIQKPVVGVISESGRSKYCGSMPRHPKKGAKHCKLYKSLGSFSHVDIVGVNKLKFTGRLHGRKLPAGSYRLVAKAAAAGLTSATQTKSFKIVH